MNAETTSTPAESEWAALRIPPTLHVCGLNHNRADISVREHFAMSPDRVRETLRRIKSSGFAQEALILSTCNRTEVYAFSPLEEIFSNELEQYFLTLSSKPVDHNHLPPLYSYEGLQASRHFFSVISGLDSMILGENEIKAQILQAHDLARETGMSGASLHRLIDAANRCAKRIKTETDLNTGTLSVGRASILRAEEALGTLEGKVCVVIGAGKVGRVAATAIAEKRPSRLLIINRTPERAREVAEGLNAEILSIPEMAPAIREADLILGAAFAPNFLVTRQMFEAVRKPVGAKKVCLIDTAVPRILDQAIGEIEGVTLLDIGDMEGIVAENHARRTAAAHKAWEIVEEEVEKFRAKSATFSLGPMVERLKNQFEELFAEFKLDDDTSIPDQTRDKLRVGHHKLKQRLLHAAIQELKSYHKELK